MPPTSTARVIERERKTTIGDIFEQARQQGLSLHEIASDLGVTLETARKYLQETGYEPVLGIRRKR
jgi:hypothetical protein